VEGCLSFVSWERTWSTEQHTAPDAHNPPPGECAGYKTRSTFRILSVQASITNSEGRWHLLRNPLSGGAAVVGTNDAKTNLASWDRGQRPRSTLSSATIFAFTEFLEVALQAVIFRLCARCYPVISTTRVSSALPMPKTQVPPALARSTKITCSSGKASSWRLCRTRPASSCPQRCSRRRGCCCMPQAGRDRRT
jgi:hypothetical protein